MDTPDKINQHTPSSFLNKFEDSSVFNYISTLSPIKTFKLSHNAQSFSLLGFASPHSLLTPSSTNCPHESKTKSGYKFSRDDGKSIISETSGVAQAADLQIKGQGKFPSGAEETVGQIKESSSVVNDLPLSVKYDYAGPDSDLGHCGAVNPDCQLNVAKQKILPADIAQDVSKESEDLLEKERSKEGFEVEHNRNVCVWQKFVFEASDIWNCHSPSMETHQEELHDKNLDSGALSFVTEVLQAPYENIDDSQKMNSPCISTETNEEPWKQIAPSQVSPGIARAVFAEEVIRCATTDGDDKFPHICLGFSI